VNAGIRADPQYMPMLQDIVDRVGTCSEISKMDLTKGYYQVKVIEKDQEKMAFLSPYGKYLFTRVFLGEGTPQLCSRS